MTWISASQKGWRIRIWGFKQSLAQSVGPTKKKVRQACEVGKDSQAGGDATSVVALLFSLLHIPSFRDKFDAAEDCIKAFRVVASTLRAPGLTALYRESVKPRTVFETQADLLADLAHSDV